MFYNLSYGFILVDKIKMSVGNETPVARKKAANKSFVAKVKEGLEHEAPVGNEARVARKKAVNQSLVAKVKEGPIPPPLCITVHYPR